MSQSFTTFPIGHCWLDKCLTTRHFHVTLIYIRNYPVVDLFVSSIWLSDHFPQRWPLCALDSGCDLDLMTSPTHHVWLILFRWMSLPFCREYKYCDTTETTANVAAFTGKARSKQEFRPLKTKQINSDRNSTCCCTLKRVVSWRPESKISHSKRIAMN